MRIRIGFGFFKTRLAFLCSFLSSRRSSKVTGISNNEANEEEGDAGEGGKEYGIVVEVRYGGRHNLARLQCFGRDRGEGRLLSASRVWIAARGVFRGRALGWQ